jgi:hypothetical protein
MLVPMRHTVASILSSLICMAVSSPISRRSSSGTWLRSNATVARSSSCAAIRSAARASSEDMVGGSAPGAVFASVTNP